MLICDGANGWLDPDLFADQSQIQIDAAQVGDLGFAVSRFLTQDQVMDHSPKSTPTPECSDADDQECDKLFKIPFILYKDGIYSLAPDAADRLSRINKPICIVTVFGAAGSGKSTLVIRSLYALDPSRNDGIYTRPETSDSDAHNRKESCDLQHVAFWMWSLPIPVPQLGGTNISVIILESGRGDLNVLFSIAVLLSCHVLYNGVGLLDDHRISDLHTIRNLTRFILS